MTPCIGKRGQNNHFCKNKMAAAAILDFGKMAINRLECTYFAKRMQQMYNILPENRSSDQKTSFDQNSRWRRLSFGISPVWKLALK